MADKRKRREIIFIPRTGWVRRRWKRRGEEREREEEVKRRKKL